MFTSAVSIYRSITEVVNVYDEYRKVLFVQQWSGHSVPSIYNIVINTRCSGQSYCCSYNIYGWNGHNAQQWSADIVSR